MKNIFFLHEVLQLQGEGIFYLSCHVCIYVRTDFDINSSTVLNNVLYCTKIGLCVIVMVLVEVKVTP
jgi:hypothetical protein